VATAEVQVERSGAIARVILRGETEMNPISAPMSLQLPGRLRELAHDGAVRCVVLTGAGERAFSAGADVRALAGTERPALEPSIDALQSNQEAAWLLHTMPKPTLAALNGVAAGMGLALACACDFRVAVEHASLTTAFARIGYSGDYGSAYFLTHILGTARARELMMLCERIDAAEALRIGLVNRVFPRAEFPAGVQELAQRLAEGPPIALRYMKRNLNLALYLHLRDSLDLEAEAQVRSGRSEDFQAAARAFLRKQKPVFEGR
jgi:2-(1,2-epoxy-1,2-dihydrophenyl)acetyl-CoA isomerase